MVCRLMMHFMCFLSIESKSALNLKKPFLGCFLDMGATYAEYEEWSDQGVAETVAQQYRKAVQQMEKCKPFEESLVNKFCSLHKVDVAALISVRAIQSCDNEVLRLVLPVWHTCMLFCAAGSRTSQAGRVSGLHRLWDEGGRPSANPDYVWAHSGGELPGTRHVGQIHHISSEYGPVSALFLIHCDSWILHLCNWLSVTLSNWTWTIRSIACNFCEHFFPDKILFVSLFGITGWLMLMFKCQCLGCFSSLSSCIH